MTYTTRFAPSPTGQLHLGHAFSALTAYNRADEYDGRFLLRIEDIDQARSKPEFERQICEDLHWLGLTWPEPVMRQSDRMSAYQSALDHLVNLGLCYPCSCSRGDIRAALSAPQEGAPMHGPDGLIYPGTCRARRMESMQDTDSLRLNMGLAMEHLGHPIAFKDAGPDKSGSHSRSSAEMINLIGDIVLARKDMGTSYHLSVVIDDAAQNITEVVRGQDLSEASFIHVTLQELLELPRLTYFHHRLIRDGNGRRLAKRDDARAIATYREAGLSPQDVIALINQS